MIEEMQKKRDELWKEHTSKYPKLCEKAGGCIRGNYYSWGFDACHDLMQSKLDKCLEALDISTKNMSVFIENFNYNGNPNHGQCLSIIMDLFELTRKTISEVRGE